MKGTEKTEGKEGLLALLSSHGANSRPIRAGQSEEEEEAERNGGRKAERRLTAS